MDHSFLSILIDKLTLRPRNSVLHFALEILSTWVLNCKIIFKKFSRFDAGPSFQKLNQFIEREQLQKIREKLLF